MYWSTNHRPNEDDWNNYYQSEIARLKREKSKAKEFIKEATVEIERLEGLRK